MDTKIRILAVDRMIGKIPITVPEIINRLARDYNIKVERKTIYDDIATLTLFRNIQKYQKGHDRFYYEEQV